MGQAEINNWARIAAHLEAEGDIDSLFYERARAFAFGEPDPSPNLALVVDEPQTRAA